MRRALPVLLTVLLCGSATPASEQTASTATKGDVQIEIHSPSADFSANEGETTD